jgi:all-trans-retinol 13,14-reductase
LETTYDIIIIGSGLSGLICGYILSKEGYKVAVLEKNKQVGGCLQTFVRDKRIFDVGVHYIGGLDEGQSLNQYFKYLGIRDSLKLQRMDLDAFDTIGFNGDDTTYKMAQGHERFVDTLSQQFPKEHLALKNYSKSIQDICHKFPLYFLEIDKAYPTSYEHLEINAQAEIASITSDPKLRAVLGGNSILYAGRGSATPFYLHAMVLNSYIESSWRCVDGGSQITRLLVKQIRKEGGVIFKQKEVDQFVFDGANIKAVQLTTGETLNCKHVISSAHPHQLSRFVRNEGGRLRKAYLNRIQRTKATPAIFSVHYTLKPNTVKYINSNYYNNKTTDVWNTIENNTKNWPATYLALTPKTSTSAIYADSLSAMCYMEYDEVKAWENSFNTVSNEFSRGASYEAFKEERAGMLLTELYKKFPQLKGNILNMYASTPLSFRDYIGCPTGSLYGFERSFDDPMRSALAVQTRIPNLRLTGQNVNIHGILGVTVSAVLACAGLVDREKLLTDIVSAT